MTSGHEILERRRALDMTQAHLAEAACVSRSTIQRAERGLPISSESLRSIRAVLHLPSTASLVPSVAASLGREPVASTAGDANAPVDRLLTTDLAILLPLLILAAAATTWNREIASFLEAVMPDRDMGRIRFEVVTGQVALTLIPAMLAGRMVWRRLFEPGCDRVVLGVGRAFAAHARPAGRIEWRRVPLPVPRWSKGSRHARTWPGAALVAILVLPTTLAMHLDPPFAYFAAGFGYDTVAQAAPAWNIEPGSPLERAGLRIGDVVTAMDGVPVHEGDDIRFRVMDAYGRSPFVTVEVSRRSPHGTDPVLAEVERVALRVPVLDDPRRLGCASLPTCAWIGDVRGLVSSVRRERFMAESLRVFATEVADVARMAVEPERRGDAVYRNRAGTFVSWMRWMSFEDAVIPASWALALVGLALVLGQGTAGALDLRIGRGRLALS